MANRAYKFRLLPTSAQESFFQQNFGCARFIWNKMLGDKIAYYGKTKTTLKNTPAQYKTEFPWLKGADSWALCNVQMNLEQAFRNFFTQKKVGFPKYKSKHKSRKSYTTNYLAIVDNYIKLPKIGLVKMIKHREVRGKIKSATISQDPDGKYFVSILVEYEYNPTPVKPRTAIGLDYSSKSLFVDNLGFSANYPRFFRDSEVNLAKAQRTLSRRTKGGRNRNRQRIVVARLHRKIANQRKNFLHNLSTAIAKQYDIVCIEDLNMQAMSQSLKLGKSTSDNGWGMFTSFLAYKLADKGKYLVKIDKWFPSSKTCSHCGKIKNNLSLSERIYHCKHCGLEIDRDQNAAINILQEGLNRSDYGDRVLKNSTLVGCSYQAPCFS